MDDVVKRLRDKVDSASRNLRVECVVITNDVECVLARLEAAEKLAFDEVLAIYNATKEADNG